MLSSNSIGGIKENFENEWLNLITKQYKVTDAPQSKSTYFKSNKI